MYKISFEQLPEAVARLHEKLDFLQRLLSSYQAPVKTEEQELLTVSQAADLLKLAKPTIYGMVSRGELPYMKRSKRVYFDRGELLAYIKAGRKMTVAEINNNVTSYLPTQKTLSHEK